MNFTKKHLAGSKVEKEPHRAGMITQAVLFPLEGRQEVQRTVQSEEHHRSDKQALMWLSRSLICFQYS
jgi:hypothetical protein